MSILTKNLLKKYCLSFIFVQSVCFFIAVKEIMLSFTFETQIPQCCNNHQPTKKSLSLFPGTSQPTFSTHVAGYVAHKTKHVTQTLDLSLSRYPLHNFNHLLLHHTTLPPCSHTQQPPSSLSVHHHHHHNQETMPPSNINCVTYSESIDLTYCIMYFHCA